jgi:hypothetical protein
VLVQIFDDYKEMYEDVCVILDSAKTDLAERDRKRQHGILVERLVLKAYTLAGNTLERYFVGLLFDVTSRSSNEDTMDDFWLGVLQRLCLLYEDRRIDRSPARMKRIKDRFERVSAGRYLQGRGWWSEDAIYVFIWGNVKVGNEKVHFSL